MDTIAEERRRAFSGWLRTGRWPGPGNRRGVELKFNPYHDPRNGRFTFAPGGPRSLSYVIISDGRPAPVRLAQRPTNPRARPGGNIRAFQDPMTLQQVFPGLRSASGGAIVAVADNLFDLTGPANRLTASLTEAHSRVLIEQIRALDPTYQFESLSTAATLEGQINQINELRLDRAAAFYRVRGETRPLQVETLRYLQTKVDLAFAEGSQRLKAGRLDVRLSSQEAVGNFVDRQVRRELRNLFASLGISTRGGQVRVIGREYDTSGTDRTYRIPDARVGGVAFDVSLTRKTLATPQIRGFFNSDFRPASVVIIRPRQLGPNSTYIITRPGS